MIEAKVRGYRGVERADLDVERIALLAGPNGAGKSSFAQAIGSVLTSEAIPMRGGNKSAAGVLVRASEA
jgi:predicted ATPase